MKIKYLLLTIIIFFSSCKDYKINIKKFFPSKELNGSTFFYKFSGKSIKGYKEIINFKNDNCILFHRKYPPIKAYINKEKFKIYKNKTFDYKLCLVNNSIIYLTDKENNVLLTKNNWDTMISKKNYLNKKNIKIDTHCKIAKLYSKKFFGKIRKIVKTECGNLFYFIFAENIGIIEKGMNPFGYKSFGYSIKLKKIKTINGKLLQETEP